MLEEKGYKFWGNMVAYAGALEADPRQMLTRDGNLESGASLMGNKASAVEFPTLLPNDGKLRIKEQQTHQV